MVLGFKEVLWCLLVPGALGVLAFALAGRGWNQRGPGLRRLGAGLIWWLGLATTLVTMSTWEWWSIDDSWKRSIWSILACLFVAAFTTAKSNSPWLTAGWATLAAASAWCILPTGNSWKDLQPIYPAWSLAIVASFTWNTLAMQSIDRRDGQRWMQWIIVAMLAITFLLATTCYSQLANWSLACLASAFVLAVLCSIRATHWSWSITPPLLLFAATMVATTRLYSIGQPAWLYTIAMFLPSIVCAVDYAAFQPRQQLGRVVTAGILSAALCGLVIWQLFANAPAESW